MRAGLAHIRDGAGAEAETAYLLALIDEQEEANAAQRALLARVLALTAGVTHWPEGFLSLWQEIKQHLDQQPD